MIMLCSCSGLYSHPEKPLEVHLKNVGQLSKQWVENLRLNIGIDKKYLSDIALIIGLAHDLGKSTLSFQRYLFEQDPEKKAVLKNHAETKHSFFGAFCGFYFIKEYIQYQGINEEIADYILLATFLSIKRHHGNLESVNNELVRNQIEPLENHFNDIEIQRFNQVLQEIFHDISIFKDYNWKWLTQKIGSFESDIGKIRSMVRKLEDKRRLDYYFLINFFYSILLDADKSDVTGLVDEYADTYVNENIVDYYKEIKGFNNFEPGKINFVRNEIYNEAIKVKEALDSEQHILSINVPTGTGKTLATLSSALKIRKHLFARDGEYRRIIYTLPFTSIIDQNYQVFQDVFEEVNQYKPGNNLLVKHHYLADGFYQVKENQEEFQEYAPLEARFIIEGWNSAIIVTTFVQLFNGLITNRNAASRKLHRIINSIIILDEVQAIPHKYWALFNCVCKFMAEKMDTYFILVTATLPLVFPADEIHELVPNKERYYNYLNRIVIETHTNEIIDIKDFQQIVLQEAQSNRTKDILVVMNTIKSAQLIYEFLRNELNVEKNEFFYLSSHIVPAERAERIKKIKNKRRKLIIRRKRQPRLKKIIKKVCKLVKRKIVVSTQLVEAGVDIDLDIVYRDMGPLDSINQVAGRCNRNYRNGRGLVKIYRIKRGNKPDASYIYDSTLLDATQKTLIQYVSDNSLIEEQYFYDMNNSYYQYLQGVISDGESNDVLKLIWRLNYTEIGNFKLIDNDYEKGDVFIEVNEEAREIWKKFVDLITIEDKWKRREQFYLFKADFQKYIISVQVNGLRVHTSSIVSGIAHIDLDYVDMYYRREGHGETGFITEGNSFAIW